MKPVQNMSMAVGALTANMFLRKVPLSVMLSVTNRCNCKCGYCDIPLRRQREMTTGELLRLIDEMARAGVKKLSLWGGEPLLRDDIGLLVRNAKDKGMCVNIDTNGYLVPEKFDDIKDLDFIIMSFDGEKEPHDKNRQPGSFDRFFDAVKYINGRIPVWTLTVLTKNNIDSVDFIVKKANEFGFKTLFQVPYHSLGPSSDLHANPQDYRRVFRHILELKQKGAPIISSTRYLDCVSKWELFPFTTHKSRLSGFPGCWAGRLFCNIDTNGDMYGCSPVIGLVSDPPNVLKGGFLKSFLSLQPLNCRSCLSGCSLEANLVFSFNWRSIFEWVNSL